MKAPFVFRQFFAAISIFFTIFLVSCNNDKNGSTAVEPEENITEKKTLTKDEAIKLIKEHFKYPHVGLVLMYTNNTQESYAAHKYSNGINTPKYLGFLKDLGFVNYYRQTNAYGALENTYTVGILPAGESYIYEDKNGRCQMIAYLRDCIINEINVNSEKGEGEIIFTDSIIKETPFIKLERNISVLKTRKLNLKLSKYDSGWKVDTEQKKAPNYPLEIAGVYDNYKDLFESQDNAIGD